MATGMGGLWATGGGLADMGGKVATGLGLLTEEII